MSVMWQLDANGKDWHKTTIEAWTLEQQKEKSVTDDFDADAITARYLLCRTAIANINKDADTRVATLKAEQERLKGLMLDFLTKTKQKSAPSASGTFFRKTTVKPSATDWGTFYDWIAEQKAFHFLHKRISVEAVNTYMEEHKGDDVGLPPGIAVVTEYDIGVRVGKGEE